MSSARTPKSPALFLNAAKTHSAKSNKINSTSSSKNIANKSLSRSYFEVPAIHQTQNPQYPNTSVESQKNIENPNLSFNLYQPSQEMQDEDSIESLKRKIDQLSDFLSRQTELINSFQTNLDRVEIITENSTNNSNLSQNSDPFLNIKYKFQLLIDNYINQQNRFDIFSENEHQKKPAAISQRAYEVDEFIQEKLGSNYTTLQLIDIFQQISKSDQIYEEEEDSNEEKLPKKSGQKLLKLVNEEDKQISDMVKSFYLNRQIHTNFVRRIEKDMELSEKVRSIFNGNENNEAILRTILSNKENANDNKRISNLSANLQQLSQKALDFSHISKKHQDELHEKDVQIDQKVKEIEYLNDQLRIQKDVIQNLNANVEEKKLNLFEKEKEIEKLKQSFENQPKTLKFVNLNKEPNEREIEISEIMKSYETRLNELQATLLNKENLFDEVRCKLSEQQKLNDLKEKENIKLRLFVNTVKSILKVNNSTI